MSDLMQGLSMLRQGMLDLGSGMSNIGDQKKAEKAANMIRQANDTPEGEAIASDVERRKITASEGLRSLASTDQIGPQQLLGMMLKKSMDPNLPPEKRAEFKENAITVAKFMEALKQTSGGDGSAKPMTMDKLKAAALIAKGATPDEILEYGTIAGAAGGQVDKASLVGMDTAIGNWVNKVNARIAEEGGKPVEAVTAPKTKTKTKAAPKKTATESTFDTITTPTKTGN